MAVAASVFDETQRATLAALCETYVPAVESDSGDPVERAFMERSALDLQLPAQIEGMLAEAMTADEIAEVAGLLHALGEHDFASLAVADRTELVHGMRAADAAAKHGLDSLRGLTLLLFYALPDDAGHNPNWEAIGYPGPVSAAPSAEQAPKTIQLEEVSGPEATLSADACVVGSGAGGSVIAARLAAAGQSVLVLEMGGYRNESDFNQLEIQGMQELYYGAGLATSEDGSIALLAGSTLGGGTVVNYMNCIPTPEPNRVRVGGARAGGPGRLRGLPGRAHRCGDGAPGCQHRGHQAERDAHAADGGAGRDGRGAPPDRAQRLAGRRPRDVRLLLRRLPARLQAVGDEDLAAGRLGRRREGRRGLRGGADPGRGRPRRGRRGRGDPRGWLNHERSPWTRRRWSWPAGRSSRPRLLLRSGIGGPAVGKHLRVHPAYVVMGAYDEPVEGWRGQIQSLVSDAYTGLEDGCGFLIEATGMHPGLMSATYPWIDGQSHKELMEAFRWHAPFITVARDHGEGEVVIDDLGRAVVRWGLQDEVDRRLAVRAHTELIRLHEAAGATQIFTMHGENLRWQRGDDLDDFLRAWRLPRTSPTTSRALRRTRWARAGWAATRPTRSPTDAASCTTPRAFGSATRQPSPPLPG